MEINCYAWEIIKKNNNERNIYKVSSCAFECVPHYLLRTNAFRFYYVVCNRFKFFTRYKCYLFSKMCYYSFLIGLKFITVSLVLNSKGSMKYQWSSEYKFISFGLLFASSECYDIILFINFFNDNLFNYS